MKTTFIYLLAVLTCLTVETVVSKGNAADLQAVIQERTLYLQGTSQSDSVGITYDGQAWIVSGIGVIDASAFDAIDIRLGAGDDMLSFIPRSSVNISSLAIRLGSGNDFVELGEAPYTSNLLGVAGDVRVEGGSGNDKISIFSVIIDGELVVQTGSADDDLFLTGLSVAGPVSITCDAGNDRVTTAASANAFSSSVSIDTGSGSDLIVFESGTQPIGGTLTILLGGGEDILGVVLSTAVWGDLVLDGDAQYDELWLPSPEVALSRVKGVVSIQRFENVFDAVYEFIE